MFIQHHTSRRKRDHLPILDIILCIWVSELGEDDVYNPTLVIGSEPFFVHETLVKCVFVQNWTAIFEE